VTAYRINGTTLPERRTGDLFVVDGRFTFAEVESAETLLEGAALLPGLVDVHAHLSLASPAPGTATPRERVEASSRAQLDAGVLLVREPGSPDHESAGIGPAMGLPRTITAGRFLAPPGRYFPGLAREVAEDELPDAAEEELRASGAWVKVVGDSPIPGPGLRRTFGADALTETAARVHAGGGRIAIHCGDPEVIQSAIEAGFDSLEHATALRPDQLAEAVSRGIAWVPTCSIGPGIKALTRELGWPEAEVGVVDGYVDGLPATIRVAADGGMTILAGTDAGMGPHGKIWLEVGLLLAAGVPTETAVGAASWTARSWLGLPGIEEGAPADLVAFREDPLEDASTLADPVLVILDGQLVRDPR
jgi:imidazolonepropionase-like amidohydrolase